MGPCLAMAARTREMRNPSRRGTFCRKGEGQRIVLGMFNRVEASKIVSSNGTVQIGDRPAYWPIDPQREGGVQPSKPSFSATLHDSSLAVVTLLAPSPLAQRSDRMHETLAGLKSVKIPPVTGGCGGLHRRAVTHPKGSILRSYCKEGGGRCTLRTDRS